MKKVILFLGLTLYLFSCEPKENPCDYVDCMASPYFYISLEKNEQTYFTEDVSLEDASGNTIYIEKVSSAARQYYIIDPLSTDTDLVLIVEDSLSFDLDITYEQLGDSECCGPYYEVSEFKVNGMVVQATVLEQIGEAGFLIKI